MRRRMAWAEITVQAKGAGLLTWPMAWRIARARCDDSAESMIDADWLGDWAHLGYGDPAYVSFAAYALRRALAEPCSEVDDAEHELWRSRRWAQRLDGHLRFARRSQLGWGVGLV